VKQEEVAKREQARKVSLGDQLTWLDYEFGGPGAGQNGYRGMSIRFPKEQHGEFLITIRSESDQGEPIVAFHGGNSLSDALAGLSERLRNGTLKWKIDQYGFK
jgi:hypothetical protein